MEKFTQRYTVTANEMDNQYRISQNAFLLFFQDTFARYFGKIHMAAFDLVKENKLFIINELEMKINPVEVFWTEEIDVTMWVSELTPLRIYSDFCFHKVRTGELIGQGSSCWCLINSETHRLERIDPYFDRITVVPEMMTETHKKMRFPSEGEQLMQVSHKVNMLDLDFNGHVNNRSYLSIAMLTATPEFLATNRTKHFVIHWLRETYLDDTMTCTLKKISDGEYVHVLTNGAGVAVAEIYSRWEPWGELSDVSETISRDY
ncbi:MAG: hypothetical protein K6A41_08230 [Bacteroidales bacterium]|nr:hypothetical protein [Bacteroidales bacterium]